MNSRITKALLAVAILAVVLAAGILIGRRSPVPDQTAANGTAPQQQAARPLRNALRTGVRDPYQRSLAIYEFRRRRRAAPTGVAKSSITNAGSATTSLPGAERARPQDSVPTQAAAVGTADDGRRGQGGNPRSGAGMAAYKYTLNDADINDLVSYLKSDCCWNSESPPSNPNFRGAGDGLTQ
jgi:hypothetical protein